MENTKTFPTGKSDMDIAILSKLSILDLLNVSQVNTQLYKLCNYPELWRLKALYDYKINLKEITCPEKYKNLYIQLFTFDLIPAKSKNKLGDIIKEHQQKLCDPIDRDLFDKIKEYIKKIWPSDENLCKALISREMGPEFVQGKSSVYCDRLASIVAFRTLREYGEYFSLVWAIDEYIDLCYMLLQQKTEHFDAISEMIYLNLEEYQDTIEGLKKVGMDLIEIFNQNNRYITPLERFYKTINIKAIDYFLEQGYILGDEDIKIMNNFQRREPNKYRNIFEKYLRKV